jgi:hypothetical protein
MIFSFLLIYCIKENIINKYICTHITCALHLGEEIPLRIKLINRVTRVINISHISLCIIMYMHKHAASKKQKDEENQCNKPTLSKKKKNQQF